MLARAASALRLALLASACLSCAHTASQVPAWYQANPTGEGQSDDVAGRAACGPEVAPQDRLSCAIARATEEAVLQVRAHVTAYRARSCRLDATKTQGAGAVSVGAESSCETVLSGASEESLDVANAAPRRFQCDATHCFALVVLSRAALASRLELETQAQRATFEDRLTRAGASDLLGGLSLLGAAEALAGPLDATDGLLLALRGAASAHAGYAARVLAARRARLEGISVSLHVGDGVAPAPERVFAAASELLSAQGSEHIELQSACQTNGLCIDYAPDAHVPSDAQPVHAQDGLWTVDYGGLLRVSTAGGVARECAVRGHGVARSADSARRDAEDRLAGAVRAAVEALILGHTDSG